MNRLCIDEREMRDVKGREAGVCVVGEAASELSDGSEVRIGRYCCEVIVGV